MGAGDAIPWQVLSAVCHCIVEASIRVVQHSSLFVTTPESREGGQRARPTGETYSGSRGAKLAEHGKKLRYISVVHEISCTKNRNTTLLFLGKREEKCTNCQVST